jgi:archaellum component FlaF (FlaF/FlaG flagellin family)
MKFTAKTLSTTLAATALVLSSSVFAEGHGQGGYEQEGHGSSLGLAGTTLGTSGIPNLLGTSSIPTLIGTATTAATRLGATLVAGIGATSTGAVQYAYNATTGAGILQARIHVPVDGIIIKDSNTAVSDTVTLTFSNGASYTLAISEIDFTSSGTITTATETAEYSLAASDNGTTYTITLGKGTETALPALAAGNTVSVSVNGSASILTGTLATATGY